MQTLNRLFLVDSIQLQRSCSLCTQSTIDGCAGLHRDQRLRQHDSFHISGRSNGDLAGDLPEPVLCLYATRQRNGNTIRQREILRNLQDEDVVRDTQ